MKDIEKTSDLSQSCTIDIDYETEHHLTKHYPTIYKVPQNMKDAHKDTNKGVYYNPMLLSIGPFHYEENKVNHMEDRKRQYSQKALQKKFQDEEYGICCLREKVKELEKEAQDCYSEKFCIESDAFVEMMVRDGCCIIHLLRSYGTSTKKNGSVGVPIFTRTLRSLQQDLIMLENQIPYCVLKKLYELTKVDGESEPSLPELIVTFFNPLLPREDVKKRVDVNGDFNHMLDVFRSTFLPSKKNGAKAQKGEAMATKSAHNKKTGDWNCISCGAMQKLKDLIPCKKTDEDISTDQNRQYIPCATELSKTPITFKKAKGANLLEISFNSNDGSLSIPPLHINDSTFCLLFNFIAYEQCDEYVDPYFTAYYMFLDGLIESTKDVKMLRQNGIFDHSLSSDVKATNVINNFGKTIISELDKCYLSNQMKDIDDYLKEYDKSQWRQFKSKCRIWWEQLIEKYFSSPWAFISLLAASVLLVLTVIQTIYTVR